ncbi:cupin domain-containing protein [Microbulbifer hainanensis]|uniref:cupin domain-containing protein n=1 Tax=Microbulbifer hainanensis TaxID=2735675 RepID=UPI001868929D|nr:cupin domain-containing protein [Microbulbifer hainanensis]
MKLKTSTLATLMMLFALVAHSMLGISGETPDVKPLLEIPLPEFPGKETSMIEVRYPPGGSDPIHRHNAHAFVYVPEGHAEMQLKGKDPVQLGPGDTFYEDPKAIHLVGRNLSDTEEARFVVFLIKDQGAPLLTPVER